MATKGFGAWHVSMSAQFFFQCQSADALMRRTILYVKLCQHANMPMYPHH